MLMHFVARSGRDWLRGRSAGAPGRCSDDLHLVAANDWLMRSIDACDGNGSSKAYRILSGWMPAYPETSGYIIPTVIALGRELQDSSCNDKASRIGHWLCGIQQPDGGFLAGEVGSGLPTDVFDTGMILLGFNALLHLRPTQPLQEAASRAAHFLVASMDEDGSFTRNTYCNLVHAYNVRSAWALAAYAQISGQPSFMEAARANARWTCAQQNATGLYENNSFKPGRTPNTHGLAYVMQGLLQIHDLTGDETCLESVTAAADRVVSLYEREGWLPADIAPDGKFSSKHICLTGYAQLAIVLYRLSQIRRCQAYRDTADRLLDFVAGTQDIGDGGRPWQGGIAGSLPIYGRYAPLQYPNWATKFFIDALIARRHVDREAPSADLLRYCMG